jgi:YggT family protein
VSVVSAVLGTALWVYTLILWARLIIETLRQFRPDWRPRRLGLVLAEITYTLTDPPLKLVRRFVKPVRLGGAAIDFSWTIVLVAVYILSAIVR